MKHFEEYQTIIAKGIEEYQFTRKPSELYEPLNHLLNYGGKRLRPIMLLMACDFFGGNLDEALPPALAVEFFHNFTLIHDDIMDGAFLRRGFPTIHAQYGINTGILSGDALLIKSYQFFENLEPPLFKECLQLFSETAALLCEGQQQDVNFENTSKVSYKDYLRMISNKTAVLTAAALKIGALIAGADKKDAQHLYNYGLNVGIAFQIMDDYLDVFGNREKFGKKHAGDIFENKKTILYLIAKQFADEKDKEELEFWYSKKTDNIDKIYSVEKIFRKVQVDRKVLRLVTRYNDKSRYYLNKIDCSDAQKQPFIELNNYLLKREF